MTKPMTRPLAALGAFVIAFAAACTASTPQSALPSAASATPSGGGSASPAASTSGPVTLKVAFWLQNEFWDQTIADFEAAHPGVTVEYESVPYAQYYDKVGAYVAANDGADVMGLEAGGIVKQYQPNLLALNAELSNLVEAVNGSSFFCADLDCSKDIFSVPFSLQGHPIYYNKRVFTEAGLDPEQPPATWSALIEACDAILAIGKPCWSMGAKDFGLLLLMAQLPLETADEAEIQGFLAGTAKWTDKPVVDAFRIYEDMIKRGWFQDNAIEQNVAPEAQTLFVQDGAGLFQGLISDVYHWRELGASMGYDNFGVMALPAIQPDVPVAGVQPGPYAGTLGVSGSTAFVIPAWTKHREEALEWIRFVESREVQSRAVAQSGTWAALKDVDTSTVQAPQFAALQTIVDASKIGPFGSYTGPKTAGEQNAQMQAMLIGSATADDAIAAIQAAQEQP